MKKICVLCLFLILCGSIPVQAWWIFGREPKPVVEPTPAEALRNQVGVWLGDTLVNVPSRRVRSILLPGGGISDAGTSWGAALNCMPADTMRVFMLFSPGKGGLPSEARAVIPKLDSITTLLGNVRLDRGICDTLLMEKNLYTEGNMNEAGLERVSMLCALWQEKLRSYSVIPIFLGNRTAPEKICSSLLKYHTDRQSLFLCFLPDDLPEGKAASMLNGNDELKKTDEMPVSFKIAQGLSKSIGLQACSTALSSARPSRGIEPPGHLKIVAYVEQAWLSDAIEAANRPGFVNEFEGNMLVHLSRKIVESQVLKTDSPQMPVFAQNLLQPYGCQIEIFLDGKSLGQFTTMPGTQPLTNSVVINTAKYFKEGAAGAGLKKEDLNRIKISLSILSIPAVVKFNSLTELYNNLKPGVHGVLATIDGKQAGFVPVVWSQVKTPEVFVMALCRRLGKKPEDLMKKDSVVKTFEVETFKE